MLFLLLTACAPEGTDNESGRESYLDRRDDEDTQPTARTCDEALTDLGYDPWHPTEENHENWHVFGVSDIDWDATGRKWLAVRWEADNERGFNVSCDWLDSCPYVEASGLPEYWACSLEAGVDPFADPDCAQGLTEAASTGGCRYYDYDNEGVYEREVDPENGCP